MMPSMPAITDRWYQTEACNAFFSFVMREHDPCRNPLLILPTGTGKSVIIARIIQRALEAWGDTRVLMLSHVGELVRQDADKLLKVWPDAPLGICSATLGQRDTLSPIIFGSVQTVWGFLKKDPLLLGRRGLVIIDECHLVSDSETTTYRKVLEALRSECPSMRVLGLTATPYRMKGGRLVEQENPVFTDEVYDLTRSFERLIGEGYLSRVITMRPEKVIDLTGIHTKMGDFARGEIEKRLSEGDTLREACRIVRDVAARQGRRAWIFFVTGIANGEIVKAILDEMEIKAAAVNSSHPQEENDAALTAFREGRLTALVSADQLTTGFDAPNIDLIAMLRPTKSVGLYVQMVGRGLRVAPGKKDCLVLDFARNIERLGPINDPFVPASGAGGKETPEEAKEREKAQRMKTCPDCEAYVRAWEKFCPYCGHDFSVMELTAEGMDAEILSLLHETYGFTVARGHALVTLTGMRLRKHTGTSGIPCVRMELSYRDRDRKRNASVYLCFDHKGRPRRQAMRRWQLFRGQMPAPSSVDEALERGKELKTPLALDIVKRNFYQDRMSDTIYTLIWPEGVTDFTEEASWS